MKSFDKKEILMFSFLAFLTFFLFFFNLGNVGLLEPDEGRYSEIPREMIESSDWIVPKLNGVLYFEKPPLVYWLVAISFKVFGYNEFAGRFPGAFLGAIGIFLTYFLARRMYGKKCAFYSSLILLTSLEYFFVSRIILLDIPLAFFITLTFSSFYFYLTSEKRSKFWLILFYIGMALGTLTKGPVAIVLPVGILFVFLLLTSNLKYFISDKTHFAGLAVFSVLTVPWFILVTIREPSFFNFFFIREHVLRFLTNEHNRNEPFYYFFLIILAGFFPWIVYIPFSLKRYLKVFPLSVFKDKELNKFLFLFLWSAGIFGFFSISGSKLVAYIVPIFPAISIMAGLLIAHIIDDKAVLRKEHYVIFSLLIILVIIFSGFMIYFALFRHKIEGLSIIISLIGVFLISGFGLSWYLFFRKNRRGSAFLTQIISVAIMQFLVILSLQRAEYYLSAKSIMVKLKDIKNQNDRVYSFGCYQQSMPFYLGERVKIIDWRGELEFGIDKLDEKIRNIWFLKGRNEFLLAELEKEGRMFIVMKEGDYEAFMKNHPSANLFKLISANETLLLTNEPAEKNKCSSEL